MFTQGETRQVKCKSKSNPPFRERKIRYSSHVKHVQSTLYQLQKLSKLRDSKEQFQAAMDHDNTIRRAMQGYMIASQPIPRKCELFHEALKSHRVSPKPSDTLTTS